LIVSLIVAMDEARGIGIDGHLSWHLSTDLRRFKSITMDHHLIMGRKTYDSIGRPLPGRTMIVVTRNSEFQAEGCLIAHSLEDALEIARQGGESEVFIIGGGEIFVQSLEMAERIYLTLVHTVTEADVFFPVHEANDWVEIESTEHEADNKNQYPSTFKILQLRDDDLVSGAS
jgi:dihydrofolate reductase